LFIKQINYYIIIIMTTSIINIPQFEEKTIKGFELREEIKENPENNVKLALLEYFKLKERFEAELVKEKKKLLNNINLSRTERKAEYLKLKPKCVNCGRPSQKGTIFTTTFRPDEEDNKSEGIRIYKALCGVIAEPCNLNIEIEVGHYDSIEETLNNLQLSIKYLKSIIIEDKNKLLFGLLSEEKAIENFDVNKKYLNDLTSIYEDYLNKWNQLTNSIEEKNALEEKTMLYYSYISQIKEAIKEMRVTNDEVYSRDAVFIYQNNLRPLNNELMALKYKDCAIDVENSNYYLIQKPYKLEDSLITTFNDNVKSFILGAPKKSKLTKKEKLLMQERENNEQLKLEQQKGQPKIQEIPRETPTFGQGPDGLLWTNDAYNNLWAKLPSKLKDEFKLNIDWMNEFMYKCVNERQKPGFQSCKLINPPNIIIPPQTDKKGNYDFGIPIYNKVFNKLSKSLQKTYLTLYREDINTKAKDYKQFEDALTDLIGKELGMERGIF